MNALEIKNLNKSFIGFSLDNISLTLPSGCIMGFVGENGAGKTTTIKLILDILHADSGSICILGRDNKENIALTKEDVGVVMDEAGIPECFTVLQVGRIMKHTFRNWDESEYARLIKKMSLPENKEFKDFSRGMKMKLSIAIAMSHGAKLLLLDEPVSGLDPNAASQMYDIIEDLNKKSGITVIMISHDVSASLGYATHILHIKDKATHFFGSKDEYIGSGFGAAFLGGGTRD